MKYRIQMEAVFNNTYANDILNEIESVKANVYDAEQSTAVSIIRKCEKLEVVEEAGEATLYDSVDFNASQDNHTGSPSGISEFRVNLDVSFDTESECNDLLNYIEGIKSNASNSYGRICRWFQCRHEENTPLSKDGAYSYIDFDGEQIEH